MHLPLSFFSDASLSWGNDTPEKMIATSIDKGYGSIALIDNDSMSATIKFLRNAQKEKIGSIVGATLSVHIPELEDIVWKTKNEQILLPLEKFLEHGLDDKSATISAFNELFLVLKKLKTSITDPTHRKIALAVRALQGKMGIEISKDPSFVAPKKDNIEESLKSIIDIASPLSLSFPEGQSIVDALSQIYQHLDAVDFERPISKLFFYARSLTGYRQLLSLASIKAKVKKSNISEKTAAPLALTLNDIEKHKKDIAVIDPLQGYSVIGQALEATSDLEKQRKIIEQASLLLSNTLTAIGLPYKADRRQKEIARDCEFKTVALPTAHYAEKEDYEAFCVKVAIHNDEKVSDFTFEKPKKDTFIVDYDKVCDYYRQASKEISIDISFWDNNIPSTEVPLGDVYLPNYDMPVKEVVEHAFRWFKQEDAVFSDDQSALAALDEWIKSDIPEGKDLATYRQKKLNDFCMHKITMEGLPERLAMEYGENASKHEKEYLERIEHEYRVIESMGFSGYFLIQYDFVDKARSVGVPVGPGRGSAAGSLIVYCMRITDIDPLVHDLQFERFLNPERVSMPDIDVDFGKGRGVDRGTVLSYIREKYQQPGSEFPSSSQIANIMRYQLKSAISAVRKAYNLSMTFDAHLKKLVSEAEQSLGISEPKSISWDELMGLDSVVKRLAKEPMLRKVLTVARKLTGKMSSYGVHAGGVVISPTVVTDFSAMQCDNEGNYFTQFDKDDVEEAGLVKFDVLGLKTLSIVNECVAQIKENHGKEIDPRAIDFSDPSVYELICQQVLADVFQLESGGMRNLVGSLQPRDIGEIAVLSALYRPGALDSGMVTDYINVKHGREAPAYDHPALQKVTQDTLGCIVYQEQVMSIVRELAGYSLGQADLLRRAMGKKKIEEMTRQRAVYSARAMAFWREHYLEVGKKQSFSFPLDVCLIDLEKELRMLGVDSFINDNGYLCEFENVKQMMKTILGLSSDNVDLLSKRLSDYKYVVMLFQKHYQSALVSAIKTKLGDVEASRKEEVALRIYYVLSQYVRFNQIFNKVEKFAGYGFNKSHAIAYSVVTYMTAYFKRHYPAEFYSAALSFKDVTNLQSTVVEAVQKMSIKIVGPDLNKSRELFSVEDKNKVRYGLGKLKGIGHCAADIVDERNAEGLFLGLVDFIKRMHRRKALPNSRALDALSVTGAFDGFIPRRIMTDRNINGRQFISWCREQVVKNKAIVNDEDVSKIHSLTDEFSDKGFSSYLTAIASTAEIKKVPFGLKAAFKSLEESKQQPVEGENDQASVATLYQDLNSSQVFSVALRISMLMPDSRVIIDDYNALSQVEKVPSKLQEINKSSLRVLFKLRDLGEACFLKQQENAKLLTSKKIPSDGLSDSSPEDLSLLFKYANTKKDDARNFDKRLYDCMSAVNYVDDAAWAWQHHLRLNLNKAVSETLNEEREIAGFYMTSTPIKVLKIAERVEQEPPSSIIDGCPVSVDKIDGSYDEHKVTTYGIIRDVVMKTVKKEDSEYYGEKLLLFTLEDGADTINCMIFGTKQSNAFNGKVISEGAVVLLGGEVELNNFGITLHVNAVKRYFPVEDPKLHVVSRK